MREEKIELNGFDKNLWWSEEHSFRVDHRYITESK